MMRQQWRGMAGVVLRALLFGCLLLGASGCGKKKVSVSGIVKYKDKPLPGGEVVFISKDGQVYRGPIKENGSYTVEKVLPGEMEISVTPPGTGGAPTPKGGFGKAPAGVKMGPPPGANVPPEAMKAFEKGDPSKAIDLPEHYKDPGKSGLKYTVTEEGSQTHNIDLK